MGRKIFLFFLLLFSLFVFARALRETGGGFRMGKIFLEKDLQLPAKEPSSELLALLDQPFFYLDQGCQTYVFLSQDQKSVLKIIRTERFRPPFWARWILLPKRVGEKLTKGRTANLQHAMASYRIAYAFLPNETKISYVHLGQTKGLPKVQLKNRFFQTFEVDLNRVGFLIQKRAEPMKKALLEKKGDLLYAQKIIASFVSLASSMQEKNIRNRDYKIPPMTPRAA